MPNLYAKRYTLNAIRGFSLIELLIVITILGITASLVSAAFLNFEQGQRPKKAAAQLKNDLRLVQNKALVGDKGFGTDCSSDSILGGWYLSVDRDSDRYTYSGICVDINLSPPYAGERSFLEKTVVFPKNIRVSEILSGANPQDSAVIFFQSLSRGVSFHIEALVLGSPRNFFEDNTGRLTNLMAPQEPLAIKLLDLESGGTYKVKVELSGQISDVKP